VNKLRIQVTLHQGLPFLKKGFWLSDYSFFPEESFEKVGG